MAVDSPKLLKGLLLFLFTGFLLRLQVSGHISLLVSPMIATIVKLSMILLLILLIPVFISSFSIRTEGQSAHQHELHVHGQHEHCDCGHDHASAQLSGSSKFSLSLFFASLMIGFSWQPVALGSSMIPQSTTGVSTSKAVSTSADPTSVNPAVNANAQVVDQPEGADSQASIAMRFAASPDQYLGKQVTMDGFVFHPSGLPDDLFILTRYFVFCCIADATPIGIAVQTQVAQTFKNDAWVSVSGVIQSGDLQILNRYAPTAWYQGQKSSQLGLPELIANSVKVIPTPAAPYMFPR
ncbi:MAG: hypothetical protein JWN30_450 [Bacilli bacterium]|nr:hypothetical protein [Bacilli bacterium]